MSTQIQRRRGTTAQHASFTGAVGETTIDTDKEVVVVHDGVQVGGYPLMRENGSNSALALGSAGTPSLKFTGDTNTGIYSPGADQVAISTAGSGRLFLDASGNVKVGTTTNPGGNGAGVVIYTSDYPRLSFRNSTTGDTTSDGLQMYLSGNDFNIVNVETGAIIAQTSNTERLRITSTGTLNFTGAGTAGSTQAVSFNGSAPVNSLVIDSSGRLGVGTSSPTGQLSLQETTAPTIDFYTGATKRGIIKATAAVLDLNPLTGSDITFTCDSTERMRLTTAGRLGINVTSPQGILSVTKSGASTTPNLVLTSGSAGDPSSVDPSIQFSASGVESVGTTKILSTGTYGLRALAFHTGTDGAGTERVRIDSSGNILKQYGTALQSYTSGGSVSHMMSYGLWNGTGNLLVVGNTFDGIVFGTGSGTMTEKARFDASGRLLVGTSTAQGNNQLQIKANNADGGGAAFLQLGLDAGSINAAGFYLGTLNFGNQQGGVGASVRAESDAAWGGTGSTDNPGRLVFSTTADGASSPTERMRITSTGFFKATNGTYYGGTAGNSHDFSSDITNASVLNVNSNTTSFAADVLVLSATRNTSNSTYNFLSCIRQGAAIVLYVRDSGNVVNANNSYGAISDAKLKENVVDANSQWDDLKALQVRNYNFKEGQTHTQIGLVAQEAELVSPGLVSESPDRDEDGNDLGTVTKSVNYSVLYMKAVKALQEAMERIETLEAKVAALESA